MDRIKIIGGNQLNGIIPISGAKNAALPLMIASLLSNEPLILENLPHLADVEQLISILKNHGTKCKIEGSSKSKNYGHTLYLHADEITTSIAPYELVSKMRASFWVIGPLLARTKEAYVSLPGGCNIGTRPVDFILDGLKSLGAAIEIKKGYVHAHAKDGLVGKLYRFPKATVGGTHVLLMAATLAKGTTILENVAREPEIVNLADCLIEMGAKIKGAGSDRIEIEGVEALHQTRVKIIPDRIEAGTYAMAVAMTGGDVLLENMQAHLLPCVLDSLEKVGCKIISENNNLRIIRSGHKIHPVDIVTNPYPGFPTDLQAQFMALMTKSCGISRIRETIFENRFMHVQELCRLGAKIALDHQTAIIAGDNQLKGAEVKATDLRASASLVIAGLAAEGETIIHHVHHLDRGFENLEEKLSNCNASIERLTN